MLVYGSYIQVPNLGVTLFDSYSYDGVSAGIWVRHTGPKSGCKLMMLFGTYSYDGVSAGIWVGHPYRSEIWGRAGDFFFDSYFHNCVNACCCSGCAIDVKGYRFPWLEVAGE